MLRLLPGTQYEDLVATEDRVVLTDGTIVTVPRTNLSAAKALLAAERAAKRRAEKSRGPRRLSADGDRARPQHHIDTWNRNAQMA